MAPAVHPATLVGSPPATPAPSTVEQRLVASATRLFATKGFDRTSVQEIVEAAGVTKGAMYHYFDSKDDLLAAIYERILDDQRDASSGSSRPRRRSRCGCARRPSTSC